MTTLSQNIAIIGLGYVGLPLAVEFGKCLSVIGFDINLDRVNELNNGKDRTFECSYESIKSAKHLIFSNKLDDIKNSQIYILTVPTPVDQANRPNMIPLIEASKIVGQVLKKGDIVIYESTVYPGATEEICVPALEKISGLKYNSDFFCGYSPERINPGDKEHTLSKIKKVTSGSNFEIAEKVDQLYKLIISAGTHKASSIKVAEAAKVIENTQRDLNIALMNELSLIFNKLGIDTLEVLEAAGTKWNFLPFRPGLVGGHCIGVDPYYLTHKAQAVGYHPEVILAGRRINDGMGCHIATEVIKLMLKKEIPVLNSRILVLGLTFKENCPDIRNTKVIDVIGALKEFNVRVDIYDPWVNLEDAEKEYGLNCLKKEPDKDKYDAIILAVGHDQFINLGESGVKAFGRLGAVIYDVKSILPKGASDGRL